MGLFAGFVKVLSNLILDQAIAGGAATVWDQAERFRFTDALPRNAHIRFAIADSHVRALRRLVEQFETELLWFQNSSPRSDSPQIFEIEAGRAFCERARVIIHNNMAIHIDPRKIEATFSEQQSEKVFDTLVSTSFLDERGEAKDEWVREAAWTQLIASMGCNEDEVPQRFKIMFDDTSNGYMSNFAHCFRDKLKDTKNTEVFQMTTALSVAQTREVLSVRWSAIEDALKRQRAALDALRARLQLGTGHAAVLSRPRLEPIDILNHPSARFRYERAIDTLVGREDEFYAMESGFLAPVDPSRRRGLFRWHGLCGDAGSGKSRFAMELFDRVEDTWPICGFLDAPLATSDLSWIDRLDRPTFIVIDYAGGRSGVDQLLKEFAIRTQNEAWNTPVRVLLIERRRRDPIFERLIEGYFSEAVRDVGPASHDDIFELRPLDDQAILDLMHKRLGEQASDYKDAELLERLSDFDKRRRPLFAAIVAEFLKTESLPELDHDASAEQARWKLFNALIGTWREKVWAGGMRFGENSPYEQLAVLATLVKGLSVEEHVKLKQRGAGASILPEADETTIEKVSRILGPLSTSGKVDHIYPAMEPDLAGECFVLGQWVTPEGREMILRPLARTKASALVDMAWRMAPWKAADFARRCYQSYPTSAAAVSHLIPESVTPEGLLPKSMAVASLIAEYVNRHSGKADAQRLPRPDPPTIVEQQEILELYALFDEAIIEASETDLDIARTLAISTGQVVNFVARAINAKIDLLETGLRERLEDIAGGRIPERTSPGRSAFNAEAKGDGRVLH